MSRTVLLISVAGYALAIAPTLATAQLTLNFTNACGNGNWHSVCNVSGIWSNNWGQTSPGQFSVPLPGPLDTVNVLGAVTSNASFQVTQVNVPVNASLSMQAHNATLPLAVGSGILNSGTVNFLPGAMFFSGRLTNNLNSAINIDTATMQMVSATAWSNDGTMNLINGSDVQRWTGPSTDHSFSNNRTVNVSRSAPNPDPTGFANVSVFTSSLGIWNVLAGAELRFDLCDVSGNFLANINTNGSASFGTINLTNATDFVTAAGSQPWLWRGGSVTATSGIFNNRGRLDTVPATGNRFVRGNFSNEPTGNLRFVGPDGGVLIVDEFSMGSLGIIELADGADFTRWTGSANTKLLANQNQLLVTAGPANTDVSLLADLRLTSTAAARWQTISSQSSLRFSDAIISGTFIGNHQGKADLGTISLDGNASFGLLITSTQPWRWDVGGSINTNAFTFTNTSRMTVGGATASNKFVTGTFVNDSAANLTLLDETGTLLHAANFTLTNNGTLVLQNGADISLWTGSASAKSITNFGVIAATNPAANGNGSIISQFGTIASSPGARWQTTANASLAFSSCSISGTFTGNHQGVADISNTTLLANTTFTTLPSTLPWIIGPGDITTGAFTCTNTGSIENDNRPGLRRLAGTYVNAVNATWNLRPEGSIFSREGFTFTNNGNMTFFDGAGIQLWTGATSAKSFTNGPSGLITIFDSDPAQTSQSAFNALNTLVNNGQIQVLANANLQINSNSYQQNSPNALITGEPGTTITLPANTTISTGAIATQGTLATLGNLTFDSSAALRLGASTTTLAFTQFTDRLTLAAGSTLEVVVSNLSGTPLGQSVGKLVITGADQPITLNSQLRVIRSPGTSTIATNVEYVLVDANQPFTTSAFASISDELGEPDIRVITRFEGNQVILRIVERCNVADVGAQGGDANFDGLLDNNDFASFIDLFFQNDPRADVGRQGGQLGADGQFDNNDFAAFVTIFFLGCL